MTDIRYCANCRGPLAKNATACDACGVFAGDVFDGRKPRPRKPPSGVLFFLLVVTILGAAAWWLMRERIEPTQIAAPPPPLPSVKVVADRPGGARRADGAAISEAEAMRILRRHLVATTGLKDECLAVMSLVPHDGNYLFSAVDGCKGVRLGRWRVDAQTSAIKRGG
jgi:hypothetical protein